MEDLDLKQVIRIIKKRKRFLISFILAVLLLAIVYSFTATPVYEAKTKVLVNLEEKAPVNITNTLPDEFKGKEFFDTQLALITSRSLIRNVIVELNLNENPEFQPERIPFVSDLISWLKSLLKTLAAQNSSGNFSNSDPYSPLIDKILKRLNVKQIETSRVFVISFQGKSPPLVAEITNALTHEYMSKAVKLYNNPNGSTSGWLKSKLSELKIKLEKSEEELKNFKEQKDFIEVKGNRDLGSQKWGELSVELTKATSQRFQLESQIVELQAIRNDPLQLLQVQTFLGNSNLSQLQKDYADANNELSVLRKSKTSEHPDVILLTKKLHSIEQKIPAEVDNFLSSLNINLKAVVNREKSLQRALQNQKNEILKADNDSMQYSFLLQEVELNEKLYNELLNRKKELEVTSNFSSSNISIVDKAEIPYKPIKPRKGLNIILAFLFGTFGGVLLVFFQESQDNAVKTEEDLKGPLSDLFLGSVITIPDKNQTSPLSLLRDFRSLKTQFLLKTQNPTTKVFLVTSLQPGEGKAFITSNLAVSLGNSGKKVLVIDADFFNPKIASYLKSPQKPGFLDDLLHVEKVAHKTKFSNVWVVPSGKTKPASTKKQNKPVSSTLKFLPKEEKEEIPPIPDVFLSTDFQTFLKSTEKRWDYIFVKSPPVQATPDAQVIAKYCHGVILVIQTGTHDTKTILKSCQQLAGQTSEPPPGNPDKPQGIHTHKLMGLVINKLDPKHKKIEYKYYEYMG